MNRTVKALTYYPKLHADAEKALRRNSHCFLVTDDGFAHDAQIWTPRDRDEIFKTFAESSELPYRAALARVRENFSNSREIYHVTKDDLEEAMAAI